jgi:hypothetical protein
MRLGRVAGLSRTKIKSLLWRTHPAAGDLLERFLHGLLDRVDGLLGGLFGFADRLVGLSFDAEILIAGQYASSFLDSTLHYVCLAAHGNSCSYGLFRNAENKKADAVERP